MKGKREAGITKQYFFAMGTYSYDIVLFLSPGPERGCIKSYNSQAQFYNPVRNNEARKPGPLCSRAYNEPKRPLLGFFRWLLQKDVGVCVT